MSSIPILKPHKVIRALEKAGFVRKRQKGSHVQLCKLNYLVTVPLHNRDLKIKIMKSILQQANMTVEELKQYL
ncbi:MAG: type II toxin-antitoxin system HicA family toxin [Bacteroidota bacterium]|nr:type II toxin-antitoxin system HicA family toxin [Bacteroidota bacterium]